MEVDYRRRRSYIMMQNSHLRGDASSSLPKVLEALSEGAEINSQGTEGNTALHYAASFGNLDVVKVLIDNGADINGTNYDSQTPLYAAVANFRRDEEGQKDVVEFLIAKGANVNLRSNRGFTPLHRAAARCDTNLMRILIDHGASMNLPAIELKSTPLHLAAYGFLMPRTPKEVQNAKRLEAVKLLVERGADLNMRDEKLRTALHIALMREDVSTGEFLIASGADQSLLDKFGRNARECAEYIGDSNVRKGIGEFTSAEVTRALLKPASGLAT